MASPLKMVRGHHGWSRPVFNATVSPQAVSSHLAKVDVVGRAARRQHLHLPVGALELQHLKGKEKGKERKEKRKDKANGWEKKAGPSHYSAYHLLARDGCIR